MWWLHREVPQQIQSAFTMRFIGEETSKGTYNSRPAPFSNSLPIYLIIAYYSWPFIWSYILPRLVADEHRILDCASFAPWTKYDVYRSIIIYPVTNDLDNQSIILLVKNNQCTRSPECRGYDRISRKFLVDIELLVPNNFVISLYITYWPLGRSFPIFVLPLL